MSQYITGIAPETPGYGLFHVLPQLGPLDSATAVVPSVKGPIRVLAAKDTNRFRLNVSAPSGTEAIIGIPRKNCQVHSVAVNGTLLWSNGVYSGSVSGLNYVGADTAFIIFKAVPGEWHFTANVLWTPPGSTRMEGFSGEGTAPLLTCAPNPFNPLVKVVLSVMDKTGASGKNESRKLSVFDIRGIQVASLEPSEVRYNSSHLATYSWQWNAKQAASGAYIVKVNTGNGKTLTQKIVLMR
jgi:hypothetical protein